MEEAVRVVVRPEVLLVVRQAPRTPPVPEVRQVTVRLAAQEQPGRVAERAQIGRILGPVGLPLPVELKHPRVAEPILTSADKRRGLA